MGDFATKRDKLALYKDWAVAKLREFEAFQVVHIPWSENAGADMLSRFAHEAPEHISKVARIIEATAKCIGASIVEHLDVAQDLWITNLKDYLLDTRFPKDEERARKV